MPRDRPRHGVAADSPRLLEALAAPFGTYAGTAVCRAVPGSASVEALAPDLLCAVGKTEALTRRGRLGLELVELWLGAYELRSLFVTGADALAAEVWRGLCALGERVGFEVVYVSAEPTRWVDELGDVVAPRAHIYLRVDPDSAPVQAPIGTVLPEVGFPALPAACAELLEPVHASRAQAIYGECLVAAFDALPYDRLLEQAHVDGAFRAALARTPDLGAVPLAIHALRAAGILRGYDVTVPRDPLGGVAFDDLLTADRLDQLSRLVSPESAAAGVLAGMPGGWSTSPTVGPDGTWVDLAGERQRVSDRVAPLLRAWCPVGYSRLLRPKGAPPRLSDPRRRHLWRTPPPERLRLECRPIECRSLRLMADPPMEWIRPPRSSRDGHSRRVRPC